MSLHLLFGHRQEQHHHRGGHPQICCNKSYKICMILVVFNEYSLINFKHVEIMIPMNINFSLENLSSHITHYALLQHSVQILRRSYVAATKITPSTPPFTSLPTPWHDVIRRIKTTNQPHLVSHREWL
jgi:hypothetical protein